MNNDGKLHFLICGGELVWDNDYDLCDFCDVEEDDGGIVTIWSCSRCGREHCITDPDKETRIKEYNDYWQEDPGNNPKKKKTNESKS